MISMGRVLVYYDVTHQNDHSSCQAEYVFSVHTYVLAVRTYAFGVRTLHKAVHKLCDCKIQYIDMERTYIKFYNVNQFSKYITNQSL